MGIIKDIGRRVEIVNLDRFGEITIALYQQVAEGGAVYRVHSYSSIEGASDRIAFIGRVKIFFCGLVRFGGSENKTKPREKGK